ncbi:MAG: hypothetical protein Q7S40_11650 [Opitutaceae bacterium]|nr:hypothetical protein [Opitutaceae bacterium]
MLCTRNRSHEHVECDGHNECAARRDPRPELETTKFSIRAINSTLRSRPWLEATKQLRHARERGATVDPTQHHRTRGEWYEINGDLL